MACCGQARSNAVGATPLRSGLPTPSYVYEYVGETGMTVVGTATGRTYRFPNPGARQQVDLRDVRGLASVPKMLKVGYK